jgi:hypothetical protein
LQNLYYAVPPLINELALRRVFRTIATLQLVQIVTQVRTFQVRIQVLMMAIAFSVAQTHSRSALRLARSP